MKRFVLLLLLCLLCHSNGVALELPLDGYQALSDYQPQDAVELALVARVLAYQKASNRYDADAVLALYSRDAVIKTGTRNARSEYLPWQDYAGFLSDKMETWRLYHFRLKVFSPSEVRIAEKCATLELPFVLYSLPQDYWEKGLLHFDFSKETSGWLIRFDTWDIIDLHYNP